MNPQNLLVVLAGMTFVGFVVERLRLARASEAVRRLSMEWRLNFGATDSLQLTSRVASHFPVPGAASLRLRNVIYGIDGDLYRFYFTVEYTVGVTEGKRRITRVGSFVEPRDRRRGGDTSLVLGDEDDPLLDQYRSLREPDVAAFLGGPA